MRHWGIVVTTFYALAVLVMLGPGTVLLAGERPDFWVDIGNVVAQAWFLPVIFIGGQALLLFLSVDTGWRRRAPRAHVAVTGLLATALLALLILAVVVAVWLAAYPNGDAYDEQRLRWLLAALALLWLAWGAVFWLHYRDASAAVNAALRWLLRGSVLELLVVVPCHLVVRQRDECTNPAVTAYGVVTGLAIMLMSFGPGVLLLYRKRLGAYGEEQLFETMSRLRAQTPPLTEAEVQAEIEASRAARRANPADRR